MKTRFLAILIIFVLAAPVAFAQDAFHTEASTNGDFVVNGKLDAGTVEVTADVIVGDDVEDIGK